MRDNNNECKVVFVDELELPFKVVPMQFRVKVKIRDVGKDKRKAKFAKYYRAKEMQELKKAKKELEDR